MGTLTTRAPAHTIPHNGDFGVEVHRVPAGADGDGEVERINAKAAHRVGNDAAERLDVRPELRDLPPDEPRSRRGDVEDRCAEDESIRVGAGGREETRDVFDRVLAVGVDLQRVGAAEVACRREPRLHRGPLASVSRPKDRVRERFTGERLDDAPPFLGAPVVDDDDVVDVGPRSFDHAAYGRRVVEGRYENARPKRGHGRLHLEVQRAGAARRETATDLEVHARRLGPFEL